MLMLECMDCGWTGWAESDEPVSPCNCPDCDSNKLTDAG